MARYALITTTLSTLSANIRAPLIAALVEKGLWTAAQGLAYAQQTKESNQRAEALSVLAPHLSRSLLSTALKVARGIQDDYSRAKALRELASHLPEALVEEALEAACGIQDGYFQYLIPLSLFGGRDALILIWHWCFNVELAWWWRLPKGQCPWQSLSSYQQAFLLRINLSTMPIKPFIFPWASNSTSKPLKPI